MQREILSFFSVCSFLNLIYSLITLIMRCLDDGRVRCPECTEALAQVEEIDDDIEATGYIEVVKTDDRR